MGSVLHRTTKYLQTGVSATGVLSNGDPKFDPAVYVRNPDLSAVDGVPAHYWIIEPDDTVREADAAEKSAIDAARLPDIKADLVLQADTETRRRIEFGFVHEDPASSTTMTFSLSDNAQRTYTATFADAEGRIAHQASIPMGLPVLWPDKDDAAIAQFTTAVDLEAFCTSAFNAVHDRKLAGAIAKMTIAGAPDEATARAVLEAYVTSPEPV